jgi:hypothetical protein
VATFWQRPDRPVCPMRPEDLGFEESGCGGPSLGRDLTAADPGLPLSDASERARKGHARARIGRPARVSRAPAGASTDAACGQTTELSHWPLSCRA